MSDEIVSKEVAEYVVDVGGKEFQVIKTGRAQARQVVQLTRWVAEHGYRAARNIKDTSGKTSGVEFLAKFVEALDENAMIDLFTALIGCEKEDSELYFDVAILVDAAIAIYTKQPAVQRLVERFFSTDNSSITTEESSTMSEEPTDGPTTP
jgi:hypothetical protein